MACRLGTAMTRDMIGFHDPHNSKPYLEFLNAEAFEYAKGKRPLRAFQIEYQI